MTTPTQARFGTPTDEIEQAAHDWLTANLCLEGEAVMQSLADVIRGFAIKRLMRTPAPWEKPTQAQIEAVALALYNNAGAPTETLAKAAISAAARVWEPFTSEGYRALPQYDPETIERCAQVALNNYGMPYEVDERCSRLQILIAAAIRKLKDEP